MSRKVKAHLNERTIQNIVMNRIYFFICILSLISASGFTTYGQNIIIDLTIRNAAEGNQIEWNTEVNGSIAGYNIYRFENDTPVPVKLNETPIESNSYLDADVEAGVAYKYLVKAEISTGSGVNSVPVKNLVETANVYNNLFPLVETSDSSAFPNQTSGSENKIILIEPTHSPVDYSSLTNKNKNHVLDGIYENWDDTYRDIKLAWKDAGEGILSMKAVEQQPEILGAAELPHKNRFLAFHNIPDLKTAIAEYPYFFTYFDGVKIDATYLSKRDTAQCLRDKTWIDSLNLQVIVDFSREINYWPGLRFSDLREDLYDPERSDYLRSFRFFEDVLGKMKLIGAKDAIIATHSGPIDKYPMEPGIIRFCDMASENEIIVHLQNNKKRKLGAANEVSTLIANLKSDVPNIRYAANMVNNNNNLSGVISAAGSDLGLVVLGANGMNQRNAVSGSSTVDVIIYQPLHTVKPGISLYGIDVPVILDGDYTNWDEIQQDCMFLNW